MFLCIGIEKKYVCQQSDSRLQALRFTQKNKNKTWTKNNLPYRKGKFTALENIVQLFKVAFSESKKCGTEKHNLKM